MKCEEKPRRVYRTLRDSVYKTRYGAFVFYFSSDFNKRRFDSAAGEFRRKFAARIRKLYGLKVNSYNAAAMFALYHRIEHRGYYVEAIAYGITSRKITSAEDVEYNAMISYRLEGER